MYDNVYSSYNIPNHDQEQKRYDKILPMGLNSRTIMTKQIYTKSARLQK